MSSIIIGTVCVKFSSHVYMRAMTYLNIPPDYGCSDFNSFLESLVCIPSIAAVLLYFSHNLLEYADGSLLFSKELFFDVIVDIAFQEEHRQPRFPLN